MADLRYIGARYVPRFMGTYDSTQVYEGLDVVDDGNGILYISKQPVPINTPPTNHIYWAEYGRIQNVQDQIDAINDEIADMKDDTVAGSLQNQITANDNDIADMKDSAVAGSLQSQINDINSKINTFELRAVDIGKQSSKTITFSNGSHALIYIDGPVRDLMGLYNFMITNSGDITRCDKISTSDNFAGDSFAISTGTKTVTITNNNTGNAAHAYILLFVGSIVSIS